MAITTGNVISACTYGGFTTGTSVSPTEATNSLLTSPADILQAYMVDGLAIVTDPSDQGSWPAFVGFLPDDKQSKGLKDAVGVMDSPGLKEAKTMLGSMIVKYGVQITVRAKSYQEGWVKAEAIAVALDAVFRAEITNGDDTYMLHNISRTGPVSSIGRDEQRLNRFTINLLLTISRQ
jgi:hypothetical protein